MIRRGWRLAALFSLPIVLWGAAPPVDDSDPLPPPVSETLLRELPATSDMRITFATGEELTYAIKFGPIRAGTAVMSVVGEEWANGGKCWRLRSTIKSSGFFSGIFKVDDLTESWFDMKGLFSRRFTRLVNEGSYHRHDAVQIDSARNLAFYHPKGDSVAVPPRTQDVLSSIYFARGLPLDVGQSMQIPMHVDRKNAPVELRVLKRETVRVPAGTYACGVVEPILLEPGLFRNEGRVTLWVSDDANRVPVIIKTKVKVGSITAVLESHRHGTPSTGAQPPAPASAEASDTGRRGG
ncbi:MAG TPA: DUF3108 domain-containing protein [Candidatus Eisenbacteria bacterium]